MTDDEKNEARKKVLEQKEKVSARVSDLCRYIGFGLVAVVYTILTSDSKTVISIYEHYTGFLLGVAALGVLTIIFDYLQYLGGYYSVEKALKNVTGNYQYDDESFWYRLRSSAFILKQFSAFIGALILVFVIGVSATH